MIIADVPRVEMTREQLEQLERLRNAQESHALNAEEEQRRWEKQRADDRQVGGDHYLKMKVKPWEVVDGGEHEQAVGFYRWSALNYIMRAGSKGPAREDYEKALQYLEKLLEIL